MGKKVKAPFSYYGGKQFNLRRIVPVLEQIPHRVYVEAFAGAGSVFFAKHRVPVEVFADADESLINFFQVLQNPKTFSLLQQKLRYFCYSREDYYKFRKSLKSSNRIEWAYRFFMLARMCNLGKYWAGWHRSLEFQQGRKDTLRVRNSIAALPQFHRRLRRVHIECADYRKTIAKWDSPETLFYFDPPYLGSVHNYPVGPFDHKAFLRRVVDIKGKIVISSYVSELYKDALLPIGFELISWSKYAPHSAFAVRGRRERVECLWVRA